MPEAGGKYPPMDQSTNTLSFIFLEEWQAVIIKVEIIKMNIFIFFMFESYLFTGCGSTDLNVSKDSAATSFLKASNASGFIFLTGSRNAPQSTPTNFIYVLPVAIPPYLPNNRIISIDSCCNAWACSRLPVLK